MSRVFEKVLTPVTVVMSIMLLAGCSSLPRTTQSAVEPVATVAAPLAVDTQGWWHLRFKVYWSGVDDANDVETQGNHQDQYPSWHMGPLIADRVVAPVIKALGNDLFLWRFHRRAGNDATGHQFSFIFYSKPDVAARVAEAVKSNSLVEQLQASGLLLEVKYPDSSFIDKPLVADTADQRWPQEIKDSWPIFIMGASQMWLMMVESLADAQPQNEINMDVDELLRLYQQVEQELDTLWRNESRHAYFHHLNALFGYEQLLLRF